jgi:hypothetical protein
MAGPVFGSKSLDGDGAFLVLATMEAFLFFYRCASQRCWWLAMAVCVGMCRVFLQSFKGNYPCTVSLVVFVEKLL